MSGRNKKLLGLYSDEKGTVFEHPGYAPAFRTGRRLVPVPRRDLIKLPYGSYLFSLPGRRPVFHDPARGKFHVLEKDGAGAAVNAVSSFLASGYLRTFLPAYETGSAAPALSLWAYAGVAVVGGEFYVPAIRIDDDPRSDPAIHGNDPELEKKISETGKLFPGNRLVNQLALCAVEYRCLCARNFFLGRYEAPVPTAPACNADCIGCLSHQNAGSGFPASQPRLDFSPEPAEIAAVLAHHLERVRSGVASFGQGCEGEPLLRAEDLARAIAMAREKTGKGTIHINTNGSLPESAKLLMDAGLDSIRISLNSPTRKYYERYHRPVNYSFDDVLKTIGTALEAGIFVSINLFFLPGFTDMETEAESLMAFLERFPVNMIQTRNLNIDPDLYLDRIGFEESEPLGIAKLIAMLGEMFPLMKIGYYNPPKEKFGEKKMKK